MPEFHYIDRPVKIISILWEGEATDQEFVEALHQYHQEIRSHSEYDCYDELIDFCDISGIKLTSGGLLKVAQMAAKSDKRECPTKLAIVVSSSISFGFAKIYETYRRFTPRNQKIVRIFRDREQALAWLKGAKGVLE